MNRAPITPILALFLAAAAPAVAQVQEVQPFYAVVTSEKATLRCGDNDRFYKVGEAEAGLILLVDGEGQSWSRVSYPANLSAFVRVEDVEITGPTVRLTQASKLKAANVVAGYAGSWKSLMTGALPVGTTLKVIEPAKDGEGPIVGYRVSVPDTARAYVESRALRRATDSEVTAFRDKAGQVPTIAAAAKAPSTTTVTPTPTPTPGTTTIAAAPGTSPATSATPGATGNSATPTLEVVSRTSASRSSAPTTSGERRVGTAEELEGTFQAIWKQPILAAEFDELMAEYKRALDTAGPTTPKRGLEQRYQALKLRAEFRDNLRKQEEAKATLDADKVRLSEQLAEIERTRVYTIVGQLQPSTVYDGNRLPQMYRVVSVGGTAPRTLGYLKKSDEVDLEKMLGQVVGVIGDATMDRSLMLNVITPVHVDVLRSGGSELTAPITTPSPTNPDEATPPAPPAPVTDATSDASDGD